MHTIRDSCIGEGKADKAAPRVDRVTWALVAVGRHTVRNVYLEEPSPIEAILLSSTQMHACGGVES